jgi:enamine deaminase RidA (YjgF/YER057c/UK114 family)
MSQRFLDIDGVHPTGGTYSHVARAGDTLYIAGQVAKDRDNQIVGAGDIEAQCRQVFANLRTVLAECGATFSDVVKFTTILSDRSYVEPYRTVRNDTLTKPMPPNTLIIAGLVDPAFLVEVDAVAVLPARDG